MTPQSQELLNDIRRYAQFILGIASGSDWSFARTDQIHQLAIERSFEILGIALVRLEREEASVAQAISEHRSIIGFRNRIAHGYEEGLAPDVFDNVVRRHLPTLLSEVEALLGDDQA